MISSFLGLAGLVACDVGDAGAEGIATRVGHIASTVAGGEEGGEGGVANETVAGDFDFFACLVRTCSCSLMLLSDLVE